jgi:hypothetical protein
MTTIFDEELPLHNFRMPIYYSITITSGVEDMALLRKKLG